jgi:hypothetical protein
MHRQGKAAKGKTNNFNVLNSRPVNCMGFKGILAVASFMNM